MSATNSTNSLEVGFAAVDITPPIGLFMCGSLDPLLDDSLRLHSKMTAAGVDASKRIVDGVTHSFLSYVEQLDVSPKLWQEAADFLRGTMH